MPRIIKANTVEGLKGQRAAILKLADFAAEARAIVLEARKEAARIVNGARAKAEEFQRQAAENGYADGFARGLSEGQARGKAESLAQAQQKLAAESSEMADLAGKLIEELATAKARLLHSARGGMLEFALALARKIVAHVAATDIAAAQANLAKALDLAKCTGEITILVNPGQLERLREHNSKLVKAMGIRSEVHLGGDERISPGGVKLLSRRGEIDATIEAQLASVAEILLGSGQCGEGGGDVEGTYVPEAPRACGAGDDATPRECPEDPGWADTPTTNSESQASHESF